MKMTNGGNNARYTVSDQVPCSDIGRVERPHKNANPTMKAHNLCSGVSSSKRPDQAAKAPARISETPIESASVDSNSRKARSLKLLIILLAKRPSCILSSAVGAGNKQSVPALLLLLPTCYLRGAKPRFPATETQRSCAYSIGDDRRSHFYLFGVPRGTSNLRFAHTLTDSTDPALVVCGLT